MQPKPDQDGLLQIGFTKDQWNAFARMLGVDLKSLDTGDKVLTALAERLGIERRAELVKAVHVPLDVKASRPAMPTAANLERENALLRESIARDRSHNVLVQNARKRALEHENAQLRRELARR